MNLTPHDIKLIAFYLPQFHPIPENDEWWGKGFTEWTNVAKAKPMYRGHYQPHIPADLGFYDLRVPETRFAQANMAKEYGIHGFCYWHYYFGNGRRLLERPFGEVLNSKEPDFPFCLAWANQTWTGIWHGAPNRVLMEQLYLGVEDYKRHFYEILPAFIDNRYIRIDEKPVFLIYAPMDLPDPRQFTDLWRDLAIRAGIKGVYFIAMANPGWDPHLYGFDAATFHPLLLPKKNVIRSLISFMKSNKCPTLIEYSDFIELFSYNSDLNNCYYPCVMPGWDNTPRCGNNGVVLEGSTDILYEIHLRNAIRAIRHRDIDRRIVFIKSWNEWAEGNYLEPDQKHGHSYLIATKNALQSSRI